MSVERDGKILQMLQVKVAAIRDGRSIVGGRWKEG